MERKITIEEHVLYKEDYQMKMLKANSPEGFLHVGGRGVNGSSYYDYDVSGKRDMTREALKKLNEKQMNYCKTLSALIDRAKIKGLKEENERNRGKLRGFLECMEQMELLSGYEVKALYLWFISGNRGE